MLLVKTKLDKSPIHGIGLFANQFIPKGTVIFRESIFTIKLTNEEFLKLDDIPQTFVDVYGYFLDGFWRVSLDNDRFMNHSDTPNTLEIDAITTIAATDIKIGEEITTNYNLIHMEPNKIDMSQEITNIWESLEIVKEYGLLAEVIAYSLKYMKEDPTLTIGEAFNYGVNEWIK